MLTLYAFTILKLKFAALKESGHIIGIDIICGDRQIPPRRIPPGRFHPGCFPPENSTPTKPGFAKYAVDSNLFPLESSILTRAKRATNRNNAATDVERSGGEYA